MSAVTEVRTDAAAVRAILRTGWSAHRTGSRVLLAAVICVTLCGMVASALTPYPLPWRLLRFAVDVMFLVALLIIVATPASMAPEPKKPIAVTIRERMGNALRVASSILMGFLGWLLAAIVLTGLLTAPDQHPAIVVWRISTAISAAIVLNSRLIHALWNGGRILRAISTGIAFVEVIALVATISIDIPAILQTTDLATDAFVAQVTAPQGIAVSPELATAIRRNRSLAAAFDVHDNRVSASTSMADVLRFMGTHPFRNVVTNIIGTVRAHKSVQCILSGDGQMPIAGYRSQNDVLYILLPSYALCSNDYAKISGFIAGIPAEATPQERAEDVRQCASVNLAATYGAFRALRGLSRAQAYVVMLLPPNQRAYASPGGPPRGFAPCFHR
jgi:hypothetical protein